MQGERSQPALVARPAVWWGLALGAALVGGCATGVGVTDEELAEICAEPNTSCGGGLAGASVGSVGGNSSGGGLGGSASGGAFNAGGGTGPSSGGSSFANGGTGVGTAGNGGTGGQLPLAPGVCLQDDDILILYRDRNEGAASTSEPSMVLSVENPGGASFPLSDLAIRYWFTADGTSDFIWTVDYATIDGQGDIKDGVEVSFAQEFGSDYAEITFPSLTDEIGAGGVRDVQLRFHADPYQSMNQLNDFSFLSGVDTATANRNVTPYLQNVQAGGCVPGP